MIIRMTSETEKLNGSVPAASCSSSSAYPNPFVHRLHLTFLDKVQNALMTVTVVPLRLFLIAVCLVLSWLFASIALAQRCPDDIKKPLTGWRNWLRPVVVFFCRALFFVGGFHWVKVKGRRATSCEAPILVVAPHSSYFDALLVTFLDLTTIVAKSSAADVPFFGTLTRYTQPVFVSREDPHSRHNTVKEIKRRAQERGRWPQVIIFPEGTCTNRKCLISYKPGAFLPGAPVQPVCVKYDNKLDTITWTWDGPGAFSLLWHTLCRFHSNLEMEFLPVYTPSNEEKNDVSLFASNVQQEMARALGVPVTDHSFEDGQVMDYIKGADVANTDRLISLHYHCKWLGLGVQVFCELIFKLYERIRRGQHLVTLKELALLLGLRISGHLSSVFDLYLMNGAGTVDLRQLVLELHLLTRPSSLLETIQLAFMVYGAKTNGCLTISQLTTVLTLFNLSDVIQQLTLNKSLISFDAFVAAAKSCEFMEKIFVKRGRRTASKEADLFEELRCVGDVAVNDKLD